MALKTKQRNLIHMLGGFPAGFLSPELMGVVYRALIDTVEQLAKIEPNDGRHRDDITLYSNQLAALPKQNSAAPRPRLDNPQQMKDVKNHLKDLETFITQQEQAKAISKVQSDSFIDQLKRLSLQMGVDAYLYHAKVAQQAGKWRLAIHYFGLAKKMLVSENASRAFDKQITQISSVIVKLEEKAQITPESEQIKSNDPSAQTAKEWEKFGTPDDAWKKKNIYD